MYIVRDQNAFVLNPNKPLRCDSNPQKKPSVMLEPNRFAHHMKKNMFLLRAFVRKHCFLSHGTSLCVDRLSSNLSNGFLWELGSHLKGFLGLSTQKIVSNNTHDSAPQEIDHDMNKTQHNTWKLFCCLHHIFSSLYLHLSNLLQWSLKMSTPFLMTFG